MDHPRAAWESAEVERRRDVDGKLYTLAEFRSFYAQFADGSSSDADGVAYEHWMGRPRCTGIFASAGASRVDMRRAGLQNIYNICI